MAGLSSSRDEHDNGGRGSGMLLWTLLIVLAVGATGVLVLSSDARLLRLAVVGALWAALIGAFAAARYRRAVAQRDNAAAELRAVYELELEREVAARREYELEVETETRRRLEGEARDDVKDDLAALRGELRSMRENLESLFGGEVLVERVALRAESTRMRSLPDQPQRMLAAAREGRQRGIVAGSIGNALHNGRSPSPAGAPNGANPANSDPQTELIRAVGADDRTEAPRREAARPERRGEVRPARSEPVRPERNRREPAEQRPQGPTVARRDPVLKSEPSPESPQDVIAAAALSRSNLAASIASARRGEPAPARAEESWPVQSWAPDNEPVDAVFNDHQQPLPRRSAAGGGSRHDLPRVSSGGSRHDLPRVSSGSSRHDLPHVAAVDPSRASRPHPLETSHWDGAIEEPPHYESAPVPPAPSSPAPEPDDAGAHASGRSVSDLLAAHGAAEPVRHRRRRSAD